MDKLSEEEIIEIIEKLRNQNTELRDKLDEKNARLELENEKLRGGINE